MFYFKIKINKFIHVNINNILLCQTTIFSQKNKIIALNLLPYVVLIEIYEKKFGLTQIRGWKKEEYFNSFLR